ncbi:SCO6880 family protein [Actinomadura kijaniata]|uniref:SCO6880 family protein n=1 Tax=Actinomadura kijaniata TaxID=46161 RepID=UPI00082BCAEA|nr:SCO6880 family protein [Actinomadura kijaniata]
MSAVRPDGYGDWRVSRSMGLGGMDTRQTVMVVAAVVVPVFTFAYIGMTAGLVTLGPALVLGVLAVSRRGGVLLIDLAVARLRWQRAHRRGETTYRGQAFAEVPRAWDLPGVLAPLRLVNVEEPGRGQVGVVWNQATGRMSATLLLSPAGALLADLSTITTQVASWGHLLASLADDDSVLHAAVTIDLVPEAGTQLADHIAERIVPDAPRLAAEVLEELVAAAPGGASQVRARLTLTADPVRGGRGARSALESAAEVARTLGALPITAAGAEVLRRATTDDLVRIVRTAFDPAADAASATAWRDLEWAEAGPVAAEEHLDHYEHDGAYSISWVLLAAPRQRVAHDVLFPLCKPGRFARRVTIMYRTLSREEAGATLEREANVAAAREYARRKSKRDPTAREHADRDRALRAARQEARGAGLVQFAMYVTTTVTDPADLEEARREVERAAGDCKLKLRVARGGQAAAFAAGLPVGLFPPDA